MAQVSISFGDIAVGVEDEDATAKQLKALALKALGEIASNFTKPLDEEEGEEVTDGTA